MANRQLHIRHPSGFSDEVFDVFCASAEVFVAHAEALLRVFRRLPTNRDHPQTAYLFGSPSLSQDRRTASISITGEWTIATRSAIEIGLAHLLWVHLPIEVLDGLEQGRTENGEATWWPPHQPPGYAHLDPDFRARMLSMLRR